MVIYVMVFIWPWELSVNRLNSSSAKTLVKHQNEWKPFSALISEASRYHIRFLRYWIYLKGTRVSSSDRQVQHENNCVISDAVYNACISKRILIMRAYVKNTGTLENKQRFLTPGHQGWNDLHSLCRIGMEYYLLNNDDNNIIYWIMMIIMIMMTMIIIMIIMMAMMIIGTATIMIMIIIITTTLTMTIMIMIKTAQTPCQSLYKDRRI